MPCFHFTASQQASLFLDIDGWLPPAQRYQQENLACAGRSLLGLVEISIFQRRVAKSRISVYRYRAAEQKRSG